MTLTYAEKFNVVESGLATSILREEHEAVLTVLTVLDQAIARLKNKEKVPVTVFDDVLEILTVFVDKCHHAKEEEVLFPLLVEGGVPKENGPVGGMLAEHEEGRSYIRQMQAGLSRWKNGENQGESILVEGAEKYIHLLRLHIMKENKVLFVLADNLLSPKLQEEITRQFEVIETEKLGVGTHERLHGIIEGLTKQAASW